MGNRRAFIADAFSDEPFGGNPAGVLPDANGLGADQMQSIAAEIGASETAFVMESGVADRRIRYFTPSTEVDLCGHATIASLVCLSQMEEFDAGTHSIETNVGVLDGRIEDDGIAWMTQSTPEIREVTIPYGRVAEALGIEEAALADVGRDLPIARSSTGLPFLIVPIAFLENLGNVDPDFDAVESLADSANAEGLYVFTFDTIDATSTIHGRAFVPGSGIPEDPVTGTASGAVGAYLRRFGAFEDFPDELKAEQGHYVDRPGIVRVSVGAEVEVGGTASVTLDGTIAEPDVDDEEILGA
ncbi:MAG: PhzF family phenazine biosynthesis protein [Halodesulfurarchaeum sp.]